MMGWKFIGILLLFLYELVTASVCSSGEICVTEGICADSRNLGQRCGDNLICCSKLNHYGDDSKSYEKGSVHLHDPTQRPYGQKSDEVSRDRNENGYSRRRNLLSDEAMRLLHEYTYKGECGVRKLQKAKISTGHTVDSGITSYAEFPWQVVILIRLNRIRRGRHGFNDAYKYHCGGVVVDKRVVITAAHCVHGIRIESLKLRFGEYNLQGTRGEIFPIIERKVVRKIVHDNYNPNKLVNDIAILLLDRSIDFRRTPHISPVCIPPRDLKFEKYTKCFITGYGEDVFKPNYGSNILKAASVTLHDEDTCKDLLFQSIKNLASGFFHSSQSCFTGTSGRDACTGDGGGPVVCPITNSKVPICSGGYGCESEHYFLAGIISWGSQDCGQEDSVTVISDMTAHREWLFNELERLRDHSSADYGRYDQNRHQSSSNVYNSQREGYQNYLPEKDIYTRRDDHY